MNQTTSDAPVNAPEPTIIGNAGYLAKNFERVEGGWIGYKIFNSMYRPPATWKIEIGSIITEPDIDTNANDDCSRGINLAISVEWIQQFISDLAYDEFGNNTADVWKVMIPDTATIVIPNYTTGKIRVSELQLLETVATVEYNTGEYDDDYDYDDDDDYNDDDDYF